MLFRSMSPCETLRLRASRRAFRIWNAIHFFSTRLKNGRVLDGGRGLGGRSARCEEYAPYSVVQVTRDPLPDEIPRLVRLHKRLVAVHVWDVREGFSLNCYS